MSIPMLFPPFPAETGDQEVEGEKARLPGAALGGESELSLAEGRGTLQHRTVGASLRESERSVHGGCRFSHGRVHRGDRDTVTPRAWSSARGTGGEGGGEAGWGPAFPTKVYT